MLQTEMFKITAVMITNPAEFLKKIRTSDRQSHLLESGSMSSAMGYSIYVSRLWITKKKTSYTIQTRSDPPANHGMMAADPRQVTAAGHAPSDN